MPYIDYRHAPEGEEPPDELRAWAAKSPNFRYIAWVHDHGWQGWKGIERQLLCNCCGNEIVPVATGYECEGCGENYQ